MKHYKEHVPARDITIHDRWGRASTYRAEAYEATVAPTLVKVHRWLHHDWGPLYLSWLDGALCPFDPQVGRKNMRCVAGRREACPGQGLLIRQRDVTHMDAATQARTLGRVICYSWCHRLNNAYWAMPQDELLAMPDDPGETAALILRRVYKDAGWATWRREQRRRRVARKRDWLQPLTPENYGAA